MTIHWYIPPGFGAFTYAQFLERGMGGSESQVLFLCRALTARGHAVTIYGDYKAASEGGVRFRPRADFRPGRARDVLVWHRIPGDPPELLARCKAGVKVVWNTDRWAVGGIESTRPHWERHLYRPADVVVNCSQYAREFTLHHYRVPEEKVRILSHAVEWERYAAADQAKHDGPPRFVYCSHPTRGLTYAMWLWPYIAEQTGGTFAVLSDVSLYGSPPEADRYRAHHPGFFNRADVYYPGCVGHRAVEAEQRRATILLYPTDMEETFCNACLECMAAGAVPVTSAIAALPETVGDCGVLVEGRPGGAGTRDYLDRYVAALLTLCQDYERRKMLAERGRAKAASLSTGEIAARFERMVTE